MQKCCVFCFAKNKDAYILLVQKCIFAKQNVTNAFDAKMHFGVHFPKENVQRTFSKGKCSAYIFLWKMFSCAKMHLMLPAKAAKCILATHHIFQRKMFSITFSKGKCSASNAFLHTRVGLYNFRKFSLFCF